MSKAPYCAEAFSPITARCFQVVSRQDGQAGWPAVTLSNENALSRFRACPPPAPPSGPQRAPDGQQKPASEANGRVVRPGPVALVAVRHRLSLTLPKPLTDQAVRTSGVVAPWAAVTPARSSGQAL
jgi:hypothetical protein